MIGNQPIPSTEAAQILTHLSALLRKDYTLATVYVELTKPRATNETTSEVARLMRQIEEEFESGTQALHGLAQGMARHAFITKRMENIGGLHEQLRELIGDQAMPLIVEKLDQLHEIQPKQIPLT